MAHRQGNLTRAMFAASLVALAATASVHAGAVEKQYVYCVASASEPGGNAYFSSIFRGTWEQSVMDEEAYFNHVSARVDDGVGRSTTYCYVLDTFDEATLDKDSGMSMVRKQGWEPVEMSWRP